MQNRLSLLLTTAFGLLLCGCTMENPLLDHSLRTTDIQCLRTEEAQRIYNDYLSNHSTRNDGEDMIFFKGDDAVPLWDEAAPSAEQSMSAVDVELCDSYLHVVIRKDKNGEPFCVTTHSRIVVMKSHETGENAVYLRVFIPDKYESDLSGCALSCEQRHDFSGLEYFSTLDGKPVAAARFRNGRITDKVFLGDTSIAEKERIFRFNSLMGGITVCRCNRVTRIMDDISQLKPGTKIKDKSTGATYICVDTDGDGKSDALTMNFRDFNDDNCGGGGSSSGGGTSGGSDSGFGGSGDSGGNSDSGSGAGDGDGMSGSSGGSDGDSGGGFGGGSSGSGGGSGSSGGSSGSSTGDNNSGSDNNSDSGDNNSDNNGNGDGSGDGTNTNGDDNSNNNSGNNSDRFNNVESKIDPFKNFVIDNLTMPEDEHKPDINLGDKTKFAGYGMNGEKDCLSLCKMIFRNYNISNYGSSANVFKLMHEVNGELKHYGNNIAQNYRNAINCIDRHLEAGRPIIVGVDYEPNKGSNEGTTDHFVVIYGRGYDSGTGRYYYNYYEVGRRVEYGYNDSANRFIYDPSEPPYFYDPISNHVGNMRYDVIQVRPNDGNTEGTIPQNSK